MKIGKSLLFVVVSVVVLVVVAVVGVALFAGKAIEVGVSQAGPRIVGVPMSLTNADVRLFRGSVRLDELTIGNPEGFDTEHAFKVQGFSMDMSVPSVFGNTVRIREIVIDSPEVVYELTVKGSNLGAIQKILTDMAPQQEDGAPDEQAGKRVEIDRLIVQNGRIALSGPFMQGRKVSVPLPRIELTNLGKKKEGATVADVSRQVLKTVMASAGTAVATSGQLGEKALEALVGAGEAATEAAKAALSAGTRAATEAMSTGMEMVGGAASGAASAGGAAVDAVSSAGSAVTDAASGAVSAGAAAVGKAGTKVTGALGGLLKRGEKEAADDK